MVQGYTDSDGTFEENRILSLQRAEYVKNYFVNIGIAPESLLIKGIEKPVEKEAKDMGEDTMFQQAISEVPSTDLDFEIPEIDAEGLVDRRYVQHQIAHQLGDDVSSQTVVL